MEVVSPCVCICCCKCVFFKNLIYSSVLIYLLFVVFEFVCLVFGGGGGGGGFFVLCVSYNCWILS